jgi:predicted PurR-regulated permease PerM
MGLIIGMPYTAPLAMVVLVCGFIPLVGHFIGMSIVTLVSITKSPTTALVALGSYIIYVQIENYVITPKIMRKSLAIPGLVTIIAALLGTSLLGLIGGLLAVPIAAAVLLIIDEVVFPCNYFNWPGRSQCNLCRKIGTNLVAAFASLWSPCNSIFGLVACSQSPS